LHFFLASFSQMSGNLSLSSWRNCRRVSFQSSTFFSACASFAEQALAREIGAHWPATLSTTALATTRTCFRLESISSRAVEVSRLALSHAAMSGLR
jgi:hypothetical protein